MRPTAFLICLVLSGLAAAGTALADPPAATTRAASAVSATAATLNGIVFAGKETTTYRFEYGTTSAYGAQTAAATTSGNAGKSVSVSISGLAPSTTYHFRLVATNASGTATGGDLAFTTPAAGTAPPAAVTIAATPATVKFGKPVTIAGQVPGNPVTKVELQQTPFPYADPFRTLAQGTTDTAANYSFQVSPALNTRYRVTAKASPSVTSAELTVLVRPRIGLRLGDRTPRQGQRVPFKGAVAPAHDGRRVRIQRRTRTGWKTIATPLLKAAAPVDGVSRSKYRKRIRLRRSGAYRAVLPAHGDHARGRSVKRRVLVH